MYRFGGSVLVLGTLLCQAAQRFPVSGLVVAVDPPRQALVVSHDDIPGYMEAMVMSFRVRDRKALESLRPGAMVAFTLVVNKESSWAENVRAVPFESAERDPVEARRLELLGTILGHGPPPALPVGQPVPDFTLIDQSGRPLRLSGFAGKVVAMNFMYTRCPLPDYCFRLSNNLSRLQKRFAERMGRDLELLSVTFDPARDQPDVLADYARIWKADLRSWHFLTGSPEEVQRVCAMFGVNFWQDEGWFTHSLHTVIVDRRGRLAANLEGNRFTARQLGDLVESVLAREH